MHHVEGAQCGLPLVYHEDGGGIVEAGLKYGIGYREDPSEALLQMAARLQEFRGKRICKFRTEQALCIFRSA